MTINVLEFLERSAGMYPDKCAVNDGENSLTYTQLLEKSMTVGSALADIVKIGKPVGVYMEKGTDTLVTFFGIVYAGGCYCMLSPELPDNRIHQMQSVIDSNIVITSANLKEKAEKIFCKESVLLLEDLEEQPCRYNLLQDIRIDWVDVNPLYINFTSGSTGVPKGIAVSHRSVIDFIFRFTDIFAINNEDTIANQAPFDFDVSVKDIYSALKVGATLTIIPRKYFSVPARLLDFLCENNVTTMIWAVSALCLITTSHGLDYRVPHTVKRILFSGEIMPQKALNDWRNHMPDTMLVNLYGPTEITCNCTYHILQPNRDYSDGIPIGKPFPNENVFLLNDNNELITSSGEVGRIIVRGTALALGYYNCPDKTAQSFIQNPLNGSYPETVYDTGDLGSYNELGELMYRGRKDNQIKYMGHRIELEEIEHAMEEIDGVERCICIFDEKRSRLKGFYVGTIEENNLHSLLHQTLPIFMIPGILRKLDAIPLTKNGKADRKQMQEITERKAK